ncbi:MAG: Calx-beta domain-containing protein, partial [Acidimicrobiales bacterium]
PGVTTMQVSVTVLGDGTQEADESFTVALTGATGAILGDASGLVTVLNDDVSSVVTITATDTSASESGDTAAFVVTRTGDTSGSLTVLLAWSGTAGLGIDYDVTVTGGTLSANGTQLTLAAGTTSATLTIRARTDSLAEPAEGVTATIQPDAAYGVGSPAAASGVIQDAALLPTLSVTGVSVPEGNRDSWTYVTVTLSAPSTTTVTVELRTYDGTAKAGSDYKALVQTLTFAPGQTSITVPIRILGDRLREGNEAFTVQLSNPTGAVLATAVATITIVDDDGGTLLASAGAPEGGTAEPLTQAELDEAVEAALAVWAAAGADPDRLASITFVIVDLGTLTLASTVGTVVAVDADAAGWGWSADPLAAPAPGDMDLLTALVHEIGHVLGFDHTEAAHHVMASVLEPGTRHLRAATRPIRAAAAGGRQRLL